MPGVVHVAGADLAWWGRGEGPAVLLVHGMADRAAGWDPIVARLSAGGVWAIAYDRRGYGGSSAPDTYERTTVAEQAEDAAMLLAGLDAPPVVAVGRDLGALVALDLAKRHRDLVTGVVAIDPPLFAFSPAATEVLGAERIALEEALRDSGPAAAVRAWLGARIAEPAGEGRLARAGEDHGAFFADFGGLATWPVGRRELRALDVPLAVLLADRAPRHVREAAEALADLVPGAELGPEADLVPAIRRLAGVAG